MSLADALGTISPQLALTLRVCFLSDTAFARGGGAGGRVDIEVDHEADGLPVIRGRTLKGLLNEECANILHSLSLILGKESDEYQVWTAAAARLFGRPGSHYSTQAILRIGPARMPAAVRRAVHYELRHGKRTPPLDPETVLASLTSVRYQTSIDETGAPSTGTLRATRSVLRETVLESGLQYWLPNEAATDPRRDLGLLAACVKGWRRGGTARNRGLGRLQATLLDENSQAVTDLYFADFIGLVAPQEATP